MENQIYIIVFSLGTLRDLQTLIISNNKLSTANDIVHLVDCKKLSIVDLSQNHIDDPEVVEVSHFN